MLETYRSLTENEMQYSILYCGWGQESALARARLLSAATSTCDSRWFVSLVPGVVREALERVRSSVRRNADVDLRFREYVGTLHPVQISRCLGKRTVDTEEGNAQLAAWMSGGTGLELQRRITAPTNDLAELTAQVSVRLRERVRDLRFAASPSQQTSRRQRLKTTVSD